VNKYLNEKDDYKNKMNANHDIIIDSILTRSKYVKELENLLEEAAKELYDYKVTFGNI